VQASAIIKNYVIPSNLVVVIYKALTPRSHRKMEKYPTINQCVLQNVLPSTNDELAQYAEKDP
jgi:hypothetical protein